VNDLATGYYHVIHPSGNMTTYINITSSAYFRNAANPSATNHPLTSADVAFTINLILANPGGTWDNYVKNITGVNATSSHQVAIDTAFPKATLIDDLVWIPILPQYLWDGAPNPLGQKKPDFLVGSGPMYYNSSLKGSWYRFTKAPNYHGATDYPIGDPRGARVVGVDGVLYTIYTDPTAMAIAMNSGQEDCIDISGEPNLFLNQVSSSFTKQITQEMAIIDVAINAIPPEFRRTTGGGFGQGNMILLDPNVRKAISMTMNRAEVVNLLYGMPTQAWSVLSPGYWQADITGKVAYDPKGAKLFLEANGYNDSDGDSYLETTNSPLCYPVAKGYVPAGTQLTFRLEAPNSDASYATIGQSWVGWARPAGIMFNYQTLSEAIMTNNAWFKADYDIWVWSWYWSPEPTSNLQVWKTTSIKPGGDNCQMPMGPWWKMVDVANKVGTSAFDENMTLALGTLDTAQRKLIVDKLQQWIYDSYCELPPVYPAGLYVCSETRYTGWGNWTQHVGRSVSSDLPWLWFDLQPTGANAMPNYAQPLAGPYTLLQNEPYTFTIQVEDPEGDAMTVTWDFGDGSPVKTNTSTGTGVKVFTQTHTYTALAMPPNGLDMSVNASDGYIGNNAISRATVYVTQPDTPPSVSSSLTMDPSLRAYRNHWTNWSVGAADSETLGIKFTWAWDDGSYNVTTRTQSVLGGGVVDAVMHRWAFTGVYSVEVFADDGSGLPGHNVSLATITYEIILNAPPEIPAISPIAGNEDLWTDCVASSSDLDADTLRFTWAWGNGTYNVTTASGTGLLTSNAAHLWATPGNYAVELSVDDLTGFVGHNVTASTVAVVWPAGTQLAPGSLSLVPRPAKAYPGTNVAFNASAVDVNGDEISFSIEFGDGTTATATSTGASAQRQYALPEFTHTYSKIRTFAVNLTASDGTLTSAPLSIDVQVFENQPPYLVLAESASGFYNRTLTLVPSLVLDNDTDVVSIWYNWSDGSASAGSATFQGEHVYQSMGNFTVTVSANDSTGLPDHNVSKTITVTVNENQRPMIRGTIVKTPDTATYEPGATVMFTIVVFDYENDTVNLTMEFDDGSTPVVLTFSPGSHVNATKYVNHTFDKARKASYHVVATVDDGMMRYHFVKSWNAQSADVNVPVKTSSSLMLYVGLIVIAVVAALLVVFFLMRRKKGAEEEVGGMEGMKPPEGPPAPPPGT
jgi:ABC-type oligopeptide transport system substrate-binding subunit